MNLDLEDRLRTTVTAEADRIEPDETTSLGTIRARGRSARRRRRVVGGSVVAVVLAVALVVSPRLGDEGANVETVDQPQRSVTSTTAPEPTSTTSATTTVTTPSSTSATSPTTTSTPETSPTDEGDQDRAMWPGPEHPGFTDPVAAARSFVQDFVGLPDPALSAFRASTTPGNGFVDVYSRGEDGQPLEHIASTLTLSESSLGEIQGFWVVIEARANDVVVDSPAPSSQTASPLTVSGRGRGFEGTIHVEVRTAWAPSGQFLAQETTTAGCCEELVPFTTTLTFGAPPSPGSGAIVATSDTGLSDGTVSFTAFPILFL